jgi:hypothetical protein
MPDMPAAFYVPLTGGLLGALGILSGVIKVLWNRYLEIADRCHEYEGKTAREAVTAIVLNSEALRANTEALSEMATKQATERINRSR